MNHLAHSILSCDDQDLLMGNMITDFLNIKEANAMHPDFQKGIALHRSIDKFMDTHSITKDAVDILRPSQGKYASVSIDLLWDYMLANNWEKYSGEAIGSYSKDIYSALKANFTRIPQRNVEIFESLISYEFLEQYGDLWRFKKVLSRMQKRAKFKANFDKMMDYISSDLPKLNEMFNEFFPQAITFVQSECGCD